MVGEKSLVVSNFDAAQRKNCQVYANKAVQKSFIYACTLSKT